MLDGRRPPGRLFYVLLSVLLWTAVSQAQTPAMTTISDVVYRADGTPAAGTLLISWPAFTTADGKPVAAGTKSVMLGAQGALSVALAPNTGAIPAGTFYTVVYQLNDGTVKTEYWTVGTTSPATIAAVRTTLGSGTATQLASRQYVDSVVGTKATDTAVVHKSGVEAISGTKQFSTPPSVPAPSLAGDAVNKAYVDAVLGTVGSGPFVLKAGDSMTGLLTLSGDPTAPSHAATRHYVDNGLITKANLVNGTVPATQLGTGAASGTTCLKGDATWGACGTSSNAISIQGVPVASTSPSDGQVITYESASGSYKPKPGGGGGLTPGMQTIKYATDFSWTQSPTSDLSTPGAKTVSLASCPTGVKGSEPEYYVYVAGTGTPEAVKVTGGTCAGDGAAGTIQFTTANAHGASYSVASASGGLQEASIAARFTPTNPTGTPQAGRVIAPPGELKLYARVSFRSSDQTIDLSGSIFECWMNDSCLFVGDPSNSNLVSDVTLINPRGRPMVAIGTNPMIEVNAQKTRIFNVATRTAPTPNSFGSYVQVDDDQAFLLDGLDTNMGYGVRCDATYCGAVVTAPGPFNTWSAVGWLKNLNISPQCGANGIDWQSGNTLRISDSVVQGYAQFGIRGGLARGGFGNIKLDNVYEESGSCTNPTGNVGQAGMLVQGGPVSISGGEGPSGTVPTFANNGSNDYRYYLVARHATYGASTPLYFGRALTSGVGNVTVTWPDIPAAASFDVLRVTFPGSGVEMAPNGTDNYAVVTGLSRTTACANGACSYTDTQAAPQAYTVAAPAYMPKLTQWPGNLILGASGDGTDILSGAMAQLDNLGSDIVTVQGSRSASVTARYCPSVGYWSPLWAVCEHAMPVDTFYQQGATIFATGRSNNLKGRLNFHKGGAAPNHIITLIDSNFDKTAATANNRPSNDANDSFVGYDQGDGNPARIGISLGAPISISEYIGNAGDGTNWKERLTASLKEFKTDVKLDGNLTVVGTCTGCGGIGNTVTGDLTVTGRVTANSFASSGVGPWSVLGSYGTLTAAPSGQSMIGFGPNGKLQVSENGTGPFEVAKANGNVATATQLAATPQQCSSGYATGVAANGDANCSTPDTVQLAERAAPTGIANFGIFWFDSACHCPKVIANNGQAVQLGLMNVFNLDANTLEEYNGTNPQVLNIYGTRTDASNYERISLTYDTTDGYQVVKSQAAGTGTAHGLGFWIGSGIKWAIASDSTLKPFVDNSYSIGTATLRPKTVYAATSVVTPAVISPNTVNRTGQTAAVATTNLLASAPIGQFEISVYAESDATCATPGPAAVSVTLGWGDRTGARTMTVALEGNGISSNAVGLGSLANFGQKVITVWNNSTSNNLTYATSYTACTTGTGTYALYLAARQVQ